MACWLAAHLASCRSTRVRWQRNRAQARIIHAPFRHRRSGPSPGGLVHLPRLRSIVAARLRCRCRDAGLEECHGHQSVRARGLEPSPLAGGCPGCRMASCFVQRKCLSKALSTYNLLRTSQVAVHCVRPCPSYPGPSRAVLRSTAFRLATSRSPRPVQRLLLFVQARWPLTLPCNSNPTRFRVTRSSSGSLRVSGTMWHDSLLSLRCRSMSLAREAASSSSSAHDMREEAATNRRRVSIADKDASSRHRAAKLPTPQLFQVDAKPHGIWHS